MNTSEITKEMSEKASEACPVTHHFSDGIYTREIFMPAGLLVVGKVHKTTHLNVVVSGRCEVMINGEIKEFKAGDIFESLEGSQKTLYIFEDTKWLTIHTNLDDEKDVDKLEERYIDNSDPRALAMGKLVETYTKEINKCLGQ
jgi:quercetin dioxygenase-like cupin family protein